MNSLRDEHDKVMHLADELKMEMRLKEDKIDGLNSELQETLRKIKEG